MKTQRRRDVMAKDLTRMFAIIRCRWTEAAKGRPICALLLTLGMAPLATFAEIYKCVGSDGKMSFSDSSVCDNKQPYAPQNEPVVKVDLASIAKRPAGEMIDLHRQDIFLPDAIEQIGEAAGIPLIPVDIQDLPITHDRPPTSWLAALQQLANDYNLDYRKAYNAVYVYQKGSMGQAIVNNPDLLRWYQDQGTWEVVKNNHALLLASQRYKSLTIEERLPALLKRVRRDIGEPAHGNAAEPVTVRETFDAGGTGTVVVNKGSYEVFEKEQIEKRIRQTQRPAARRAVLIEAGPRRIFEPWYTTKESLIIR